MISPYVRRLRLGEELEALRGTRTTEQVAKEARISRTKLSRLENGRIRPDLDEVDRILRALGATDEQWTELYSIARESSERGWWESTAADMGERQALAANLEAGATTIRHFEQKFVPGLLQTEELVRAVMEYDDLTLAGPAPASPEGMVHGREGRQRMLRRPGGPTYEAIIDEIVLLRPTAPPKVLARQFRQLAESDNDKVRVRILPVRARIESYSVPSSTFTLYTYPDPRDPVVVAVDTVTADHIYTQPHVVDRYEQQYGRLSEAALSVEDSAERLAAAAHEMEASS